MQSKNFMSQIWKFLNDKTTGSKYEKIAYYRNPDSLLDEGLVFLWIIAGACLLVSGSFGIYFHKNIFTSAFGGWAMVAGIFSLMVFVLAEIMKIGIGLIALRMLFTGIFYRSLQHLSIAIGFLAITAGAFWWSYQISTEATATINESLNRSELYKNNEYDHRSTTVGIDSQLANINQQISTLSKQVNNKGEIYWPAQKSIARLTEQQNLLQKQKSKLMDQYSSDKETYLGNEVAIIEKAALQLSEYGGKSEMLLLIVLIVIALIESQSYEANKHLFDKKQAAERVETAEKGSKEIAEGVFHSMEGNNVDAIANVGYSAIQNRLRNNPAENPGTRVDTGGSQVSHPAEKHKLMMVKEVVEDAEKQVVELCGKIQKFYPSRWSRTKSKGGKLSTMSTNFRSYLFAIDEILKDNPNTRLSAKWKERVSSYKLIYQNEIKAHL